MPVLLRMAKVVPLDFMRLVVRPAGRTQGCRRQSTTKPWRTAGLHSRTTPAHSGSECTVGSVAAHWASELRQAVAQLVELTSMHAAAHLQDGQCRPRRFGGCPLPQRRLGGTNGLDAKLPVRIQVCVCVCLLWMTLGSDNGQQDALCCEYRCRLPK
jgi:hypothetical protein